MAAIRMSRADIRPRVIRFPIVLVPLPQQTTPHTNQSEPIHSLESLLAHPLVRKHGLGYIRDMLPKTNGKGMSGCLCDTDLATAHISQ